LSVKANAVPQVYWAVENDQYNTLKRLVDSGVDVNMLRGSDLINKFAQTFHCVDEITMKAFTGVLDHLDSEAMVSPLSWAASHGRDSMVQYLLGHNAEIELESTRLCECYDELFHCPYRLPKPPEFHVRSLVRRDPIEREWPDHSYWTPLHYAICNRNVSTAQLLLERGANADYLGARATALHIATRWGLDETIHYLLDNDLVDIDATGNSDVTALHVAYVAGNYDLVDKLLDKGANINLACHAATGPWTIFSMACAEGSFDLALKYLRKGADPHFVLEDEYENKFTVMRLIYCNQHKRGVELDTMMQLEREIIKGGRPHPLET
jgi:hypothetical protein